MSHAHEHSATDRGIKFGLVLNTTFTVIEFTFGILTGSLALIADASHNLTDTLTLTVSFIANKLARRKANDSKTFGYGRATILAALINASLMLGVAGFIVFEAIQRLGQPHSIEGGIVAAVAFVGILVNGSIAYILSKNKNDLNMRSAFIDMAFDALSSLGAVVAGLVILLTGVTWIDSAVGLVIAGLLVYNTIKILLEAVQILLEGTPKDLDIQAISNTITSQDKVLSVDDLHVWTIRSGYNALSCHIAIAKTELPNSHEIVEDVKAKLEQEHGIKHATVEVELEDSRNHPHHENH